MSEHTRRVILEYGSTLTWIVGLIIIVVAVGIHYGLVPAMFAIGAIFTAGGMALDFWGA